MKTAKIADPQKNVPAQRGLLIVFISIISIDYILYS